ncbi:hypothetical protein [Marinimicrobium agarilyticum]|uniref:hypothetical protein n=1 Tax=Marinimicrobium agarilyticum TaxID=306546 RepID=UPI000484C3DA|nr:hypothetical protein [Marinimicrobium agarilyticum]
MKTFLLPFLIISSAALWSCSGDDAPRSPQTTTQRDLSDAVSLNELVARRMENDASMDGATVLIEDRLEAFFDQSQGCAADPAPCLEEDYETETSDPIYQGSGVGPCSGDGLALRSGNWSEEVLVDLNEHTQFYVLTEEQTITANFYATVRFVERQAWCSGQINYGLEITLKDGEEDYLLDQFLEDQERR